jgi:hypothetical protein
MQLAALRYHRLPEIGETRSFSGLAGNVRCWEEQTFPPAAQIGRF